MHSSTRAHDAVREDVSRVYSGAAAPVGAAKLAGYGDVQLTALPPGVAASSFGCGNPLAFANVRPGETILDLGSGAGLDLILASKQVGPAGHVIGVDMTDAMIERATRNVASAGASNVEVRKGLIEALPVRDASVDWVISNCVISLSPDKPRVFREIARVLRPGGHMLLSDILVDDSLARLLWAIRWFVPSIGYARTEAHYVRALGQAGLVDVEVRGRLVYDPEQLMVLFGGDASDVGSSCPILSLVARAGRPRLGRLVPLALAGAARGRVSSVKFYARRACRVRALIRIE